MKLSSTIASSLGCVYGGQTPSTQESITPRALSHRSPRRKRENHEPENRVEEEGREQEKREEGRGRQEIADFRGLHGPVLGIQLSGRELA